MMNKAEYLFVHLKPFGCFLYKVARVFWGVMRRRWMGKRDSEWLGILLFPCTHHRTTWAGGQEFKMRPASLLCFFPSPDSFNCTGKKKQGALDHWNEPRLRVDKWGWWSVWEFYDNEPQTLNWADKDSETTWSPDGRFWWVEGDSEQMNKKTEQGNWKVTT